MLLYQVKLYTFKHLESKKDLLSIIQTCFLRRQKNMEKIKAKQKIKITTEISKTENRKQSKSMKPKYSSLKSKINKTLPEVTKRDDTSYQNQELKRVYHDRTEKFREL